MPINVSHSSPSLRLAAVVFACSAAFAAQARPLYHVEAAEPSGAVVSLDAISNNGIAAGLATPDNGRSYYGAIAQDGSFHFADTHYADGATSTAVGVNSAGTSVGMAMLPDFMEQVPATWDVAGNRTLLKRPQNEITEVTGINDDGTACGTAHILGAIVWKDGKPKVIDEVINGSDAWTTANAINQKGWVTGGIPNLDGLMHPYLYKDGQVTELAGLGVNSVGLALNNKGHIAGSANFDVISNPPHAIWYDGSTWQDLGDLGGTRGALARGINGHDQIVGVSSVQGRNQWRAFLYEHGRLYQLDKHLDDATAPGWQLTGAYAINEAGVIVGEGTLNGVRRGFVATPVPN